MSGKTLSGFTLLELLFVILLTGIVVSLTYTYFEGFRKYMLDINHESENELRMMQFETFLRADIEKSTYLRADDYAEFAFLCPNLGISYEVGDNFMVRLKDGQNDTVFAEKIEFVPEYYPGNDTLITSINLTITEKGNHRRSYWFSKEYNLKTRFDIQLEKLVNP